MVNRSKTRRALVEAAPSDYSPRYPALCPLSPGLFGWRLFLCSITMSWPPLRISSPRDWPNQLENTTLAAMTKPSKSRTPQRATKKKSRSGHKQKPASSPKKRVAPKTNPPPQWGWETPDTTNELLLGRAAVRRRQFEAAMQPAQEEVFAPVPPSTSIGRHNELLARNSEVEETITQLEAQGIPGIGHNQPPLTSDEIAQIRELLAGSGKRQLCRRHNGRPNTRQLRVN